MTHPGYCAELLTSPAIIGPAGPVGPVTPAGPGAPAKLTCHAVYVPEPVAVVILATN